MIRLNFVTLTLVYSKLDSFKNQSADTHLRIHKLEPYELESGKKMSGPDSLTRSGLRLNTEVHEFETCQILQLESDLSST